MFDFIAPTITANRVRKAVPGLRLPRLDELHNGRLERQNDL